VVLDYNRSFAQSRNEMLLINILRSAAREPLQFSTMGQVQGSIGNGGQLTIPFTNVIAGGKDIISPSLQITDSVNPNVSIIPLGSKEFAEGILRPIRTDTIQLFLHNGWDAEFLLPLVVGGVVCPDGRLLHNSGEYIDRKGSFTTHDAFRRFFQRTGGTISIATDRASAPEEQSFTLGDKEALGVIKDGLGANYAIERVEDLGDGRKNLVVASAKSGSVRGVSVQTLCEELKVAGAEVAEQPDYRNLLGTVDILPGCCGKSKPDSQASSGKLIFRSVASIIHYLGESHRIRFRVSTRDRRGLTYLTDDGEQTLFKVDWDAGTQRRAVEVKFHDTLFSIPALDLRANEGHDRTLKTLSFLDQLIALQTNESVIRGTQPILAITQ
jgi:hypothetical protein